MQSSLAAPCTLKGTIFQSNCLAIPERDEMLGSVVGLNSRRIPVYLRDVFEIRRTLSNLRYV